jgi:hypothetical protein
LSKQAATSSSDDPVVAKIREHWESLDTNHLLAVWTENNEVEWRPETFQIIKNILEDRKVELPPQHQTNAPSTLLIDIPVRKGLGALLRSSTPKKISVRFCAECARRSESGKGLEKFGYGLAGVTFIFAAFVHPPRSQAEWEGAGGLFWLGGFLGWIGERTQRKAIGIRATRLSKDLWRFWFRCNDVASEFSQLNQPLVASEFGKLKQPPTVPPVATA